MTAAYYTYICSWSCYDSFILPVSVPSNISMPPLSIPADVLTGLTAVFYLYLFLKLSWQLYSTCICSWSCPVSCILPISVSEANLAAVFYLYLFLKLTWQLNSTCICSCSCSDSPMKASQLSTRETRATKLPSSCSRSMNSLKHKSNLATVSL